MFTPLPGLGTAEPLLIEELPSFAMADSSNSRYRVEDTGTRPQMPETHLLAALLERSVRDLCPKADPKDRREAVSWFLRKESGDDRGFSFLDCFEYLQLSCKHIRFIQAKLEEAKNIIVNIEKMDE